MHTEQHVTIKLYLLPAMPPTKYQLESPLLSIFFLFILQLVTEERSAIVGLEWQDLRSKLESGELTCVQVLCQQNF